MSINNGTMNRIGAGGKLDTFGSVQSVDNTKIHELIEAIDSATESIQEGKSAIDNTVQAGLDNISASEQIVLQTINNTATTVTDTLNNTVQEAVQNVSDEVDNAKQEISIAAATVVQYDVPVICPKDEVGCVLIKNAELGETETIEVLRPTSTPTTTAIRIGTSLDTCSLINVGATLAHWKTYGATEIKFGYQADDYCYRDEVGDVFSMVSAVLGTIDRAQPIQDTFEYPTGVTGTDYVCKITPTSIESFNKSETNQVFTIAVTDENIATYSDVWFGVYTYGSTIGSAFWFHDYAAKYGTIWITTADGEVVSYTGRPIDFAQFANTGTISDEYNPSKAYTVGEYCIYSNKLYKCIANTTAGILPTDTTYFNKTSIGNEVGVLNSNLNYSTEEVICGTYCGKTRYRKVFNLTTPSANPASITIDLSGATEIVKMEGILKENNNYIPLNYTNVDMFAQLNPSAIQFRLNSAYYNKPISITIEYVK